MRSTRGSPRAPLAVRRPPFFFFCAVRRPPRPPLFPYTTLFRSQGEGQPLRHAGPHDRRHRGARRHPAPLQDRKSTRLNSSHTVISYAVFCLKKKIEHGRITTSISFIEAALTTLTDAVAMPGPKI